MFTYLIVFLLGMYLSLATYHLLIYAGRRSDKNNLFYALIVLAFAYLTFTFSVIPKMTFIPEWWLMLFWHLSILVSYLSIGVSVFYYMVLMLKLEKCRKAVNAYMVYNIVFFVLLFTASRLPGKTFREVSVWLFYVHSPVSGSVFGYLMVMFLRRKNRTTAENQIALGIGFYGVFFMLHTVLLMADVVEAYAGGAINIGMLVTVFIFARLLAANFNREHHELIETKENLEKRVKDRTQDLVVANELIEEQSREKTAFFVNLAHETRTPATLIQNYLDTCLTRYPGDRDLKIVKRNVDKLVADMVNFLDAEKIEQGRLSYEERQRFDLHEYLHDKVELVRATAEARGLSLHASLEEGVEITTNAQGLDRVLNNLLDNAMRYTPRGGEISVVLRREEGDYALLAVADTGTGIPEEKKKHVFEKYYQLLHTKGNTQGIGMGLFITRNIVDGLGGSISFESSSAGTTFSVRLPLGSVGDAQQLESVEATPLSGMSTTVMAVKNVVSTEHPETILLVEDNIDLMLSMRESLDGGFNILCAANGKDALRLLGETVVDLVVSDVMMDEMDGYELLKEMKKQGRLREVPFVFLTAKSGVREEIRGLTSGAIDYIQKPFAVEALRARIRALLDYQILKRKAFELEKYKSVGMLTAGICHEIMNPLSGIKGPLYVIEQSASAGDPSFSEGLGHVKRNVDRIADIVGTMRSLFDGESYMMEDVSLRDVVQPIADLLAKQAADRVEFEVQIPKDSLVSSNRGALTRIMTNLLTNAVESIMESGKVTVTVLPGDALTLQIRDTGRGIPPENIARIYDVAFTTKAQTGGSGLGLYIVKELTDRLGIRMEIASKEFSGTVVSLTFAQVA